MPMVWSAKITINGVKIFFKLSDMTALFKFFLASFANHKDWVKKIGLSVLEIENGITFPISLQSSWFSRKFNYSWAEVVSLTKFQLDYAKIVNFLLRVNI